MKIRLTLQRFLLAAPLLVLGLATPGEAVELNPAALIYKLSDQLKWRDPTGAAPVNQAILQGDPTKVTMKAVPVPQEVIERLSKG